MRHILIPTLLMLGFLNHTVFAQERDVDPNLLRDIVRGHQILAQHAEVVSGKMESWGGSSQSEELTLSPRRPLLFLRNRDLLRLEYIHPIEGTEIFPGHEKNDTTEVIVKSKGHYFRYWAIPSTGVPYANLHRSTVLSEEMAITLGSDFYGNINTLTSLGGALESKVLDVLQYEIGTIEYRPYGGVVNALWIRGVEDVDANGNTSIWTVVLNPDQHYALLFHELRLENPKTGYAILSSGTRTTQVTDDGKIFPKEITFELNFCKTTFDTGKPGVRVTWN
jgi:hypothetical protein